MRILTKRATGPARKGCERSADQAAAKAQAAVLGTANEYEWNLFPSQLEISGSHTGTAASNIGKRVIELAPSFPNLITSFLRQRPAFTLQ
jgi:hypothetical protein